MLKPAAFVLFAMAATAFPAYAETAAFSHCLDAAMSDATVSQCYNAEASRQENRLQTAFDSLMARQREPIDRQRLEKAQAAWVNFRDTHCAWAWALPWGDMPDALIPLTCAMHENERRADELMQLQAFFGSGGGDFAAPSDSGSFVIPELSQRLLTRADLAGLSTAQLRIARNEIYARHGYIFENVELQAYFAAQPWYIPVGRQVTLTSIEQNNVELIRTVEAGG